MGVIGFQSSGCTGCGAFQDGPQAPVLGLGDFSDAGGLLRIPTTPRPHGPGIFKNVTTKLIGQQPGDMSALVTHLHLNEVCLEQIKQFSAPKKGQSSEVLLVIGEKAETTQVLRLLPTALDYWVCTTFPRERYYRNWFLSDNAGRPFLELYKELACKFPQGLADLPLLPEELSGEVSSIADSRSSE